MIRYTFVGKLYGLKKYTDILLKRCVHFIHNARIFLFKPFEVFSYMHANVPMRVSGLIKFAGDKGSKLSKNKFQLATIVRGIRLRHRLARLPWFVCGCIR